MKTRTFLVALFLGIFTASLFGQSSPAQLAAQIQANPEKTAQLVADAIKANPNNAGALVAAAIKANPNAVLAIVDAAVGAVQSTAVAVVDSAVGMAPQQAVPIVKTAAQRAYNQLDAIREAAIAALNRSGRNDAQTLIASVRAADVAAGVAVFTAASAITTPIDPGINVSRSR